MANARNFPASGDVSKGRVTKGHGSTIIKSGEVLLFSNIFPIGLADKLSHHKEEKTREC